MKNSVIELILAICVSSCHTRAYLGEYFTRKIKVKSRYEDGTRKAKYKVCREWGVGVKHNAYNSGYGTRCGRRWVQYHPSGKKKAVGKKRLFREPIKKGWDEDGKRIKPLPGENNEFEWPQNKKMKVKR